MTAVAALKTHEPVQARVGIATGLVVVGDLIGSGASQEQANVGDTPNLAARLQALAEPGAIVIGVCWLWPGAIVGLLFPALPVSARESVIIGALFFVGAAILLFVRPSDDEKP